MGKWSWIAIAAVLALAGCATVRQSKDDVKTGFTEPLREGEVSPQQIGQNVGAAVSAIPIPGAATAAPVIAYAAGLIAAWMRGRSIRKNQPQSSQPITGFLGDKTALESVVQNLANVSQGVTEFFKEGSAAQHAWQGLLTGLAGLGAAALTIPAVKTELVTHPQIAVLVGSAAAIFNGLQQSLSKVLPVAQPAVGSGGPAVTSGVGGEAIV